MSPYLYYICAQAIVSQVETPHEAYLVARAYAREALSD